jgi:hypothetical protein
MKEYDEGIGTIFQNEETGFSGYYNIIKESSPEIQTRLSGTFKVSGIERNRLINMLNQPPRDMIFEDKKGKRFTIQLTHIPGSQNFEDGSAQFKILFTPGNQE